MAKKKSLTIKQFNDIQKKHIAEHIKWIKNELDLRENNYSISDFVIDVDRRDFSVLQDFTDEELANELCRRTALGKELE